MDFLNFFNYVNYLHQEHLKLKQTYETLLCIVIQELPKIKARMEASEKQNIPNVQKQTQLNFNLPFSLELMLYFIFSLFTFDKCIRFRLWVYKKVDLSIAHSFALMMHSPWVFTELNFQSCFVGPRAVGSIERFVGHGWWWSARF